MLTSLLFLAFSLAVLAVLPIGISLWTDLCAYSSLLWFQHCFSRVEPANGVVWGSFATLAFLYYGLGWSDVLPLTGVVVYSVFALRHAWGCLRHRNEPPKLLLDLFRCLTALAAVALSFLLRPSPAYLFVPLALFFLGLLAERRLAARLGSRRCAGSAIPN